MKKYFIILLVLCAFSIGARANVVTGQAAVPTNYYAGVDNKTNANSILDALRVIIDNHTVISYSGLEPYYAQTDFYSDTLWDMYSTCRFTMEDANKPQKAVCDGWNKEHVVCQSWLGSGPMVSDLFNVYPTDARINNLRSNYPYGVVGSFSGFSKDPDHHGLGKLGSSTTANVGTVYEPDDNYKGDFARTFFYMVARYRNNLLNDGNGAKMFTSNPTNLTEYSLSFLLDWHRSDPVSQKEIDRNQAIYGIQHNRNPFIDYPELVEYIWGTKAGQTVSLSAMVPTCDGGGYTPDVQEKFGVNWSVCGEVVRTDSVIENRAVTQLPDAPVSCSATSDVFMGWTTEPLSGTQDEAPEVLYRTVADFPNVTADVTYYAVFACAEQSSIVEPKVFTYDADNQTGWTNTAYDNNGNYWILRTGQYIESPAVNLAGLTSITINMRTYGGASFNTILVSSGDVAVATLTASSNSLTNQTWTNTSSLSGVGVLRFTSSNSTSQNGPAFKKIIVSATGSGVTYSAYLTACGTATELMRSETMQQPAKVIRDGRLIIIWQGREYNLLGW